MLIVSLKEEGEGSVVSICRVGIFLVNVISKRYVHPKNLNIYSHENHNSKGYKGVFFFYLKRRRIISSVVVLSCHISLQWCKQIYLLQGEKNSIIKTK